MSALPTKVTVLRSGNSIVLDPPSKRLEAVLAPKLSYTEKVFLRGKEYYQAKKAKQATVFDQVWECYTLDHKKRLATSFGFLPRIEKMLTKRGVEVVVKNLTPHPRPEVFVPRWDRLKGEKLRFKQPEALELIFTHENGRIDCPPGWGKSFVIGLAARALPKAKIAVITRRVEVMQQRIYPDLCGMLPDVGIVGGGMRRKGRRVMCYTAGSIHHADGDEDIVFFDEGHEAASDDCAYKMAKFEHARMWAFSATWGMRLDNKDMRCEAMFGPVRLKVTYKEAVEHEMIVPIVVQLSNVIMDVDPCSGLDGVDKERYGIWANEYRNKLIQRDARLYDDDVQCLITVKTLEHGLYLKKLLPEYELVYNPESQEPKDWSWFKKQGLLPEDFKILSDKRRERLRTRFERGKLRKVIATPVWNIGVNMKHLQVVLRADAGGSPINDTQIPGRGSRIIEINGLKKMCAVVHDYLDQFNSGYERKADGRVKSYKGNEWEIRYPDKKKKSLLRQLMEWGEV